MKPIAIDFKRARAGLGGLSLALLAAGLIAVAYVGSAQRELAARIRDAESRVNRLEQTGTRRLPVTHAEDGAALQLEVRQANAILRELAMPWNGLFTAVETSGEKDVALLSVQPDAQRRVLRLSGEARNLAALLRYVERLEKNPALSRVYLTQHEIRGQDPERPVRFALNADWTPAAAEVHR